MSARTDRERMLWSIQHSAQVFWRQAPTRLVAVGYFPNGQDGFIAAEVEELGVPCTIARAVNPDGFATKDDAIIAALDQAMDESVSNPHPKAHDTTPGSQ